MTHKVDVIGFIGSGFLMNFDYSLLILGNWIMNDLKGYFKQISKYLTTIVGGAPDNSEETEVEVWDVGDVQVADESDSDFELISEYIENMEKLKAQNLENILDEGVKKSVKNFNKKMRKILSGATQALQKIN